MLTITISVLFTLAAVAALAVIHTSLVAGARRTRAILAELGEIEHGQRVIRMRPARVQPRGALLPLLAAA